MVQQELQQQTIADTDIQRAEFVGSDTIRTIFDALTGNARDMENFIETLGVGDKSIDFDVDQKELGHS